MCLKLIETSFWVIWFKSTQLPFCSGDRQHFSPFISLKVLSTRPTTGKFALSCQIFIYFRKQGLGVSNLIFQNSWDEVCKVHIAFPFVTVTQWLGQCTILPKLGVQFSTNIIFHFSAIHFANYFVLKISQRYDIHDFQSPWKP